MAIEAALSDDKHQELLARALTIAQDTAMRDKRWALGRALAAAASDTGTKVDDELLLIRLLGDLDEPHIRCLRIVTVPRTSEDTAENAARFGVTEHQYQRLRDHFTDPAYAQVYGWTASDVTKLDPGLDPVAYRLLRDLERLGIVNTHDSDRVIRFGPTFLAAQLLHLLE